jgi:hypothetical protein
MITIFCSSTVDYIDIAPTIQQYIHISKYLLLIVVLTAIVTQTMLQYVAKHVPPTDGKEHASCFADFSSVYISLQAMIAEQKKPNNTTNVVEAHGDKSTEVSMDIIPLVLFIAFCIFQILLRTIVETYLIQRYMYNTAIEQTRTMLHCNYNIADKSFVISNQIKCYVSEQCAKQFAVCSLFCLIAANIAASLMQNSYNQKLYNVIINVLLAMLVIANKYTAFMHDKTKYIIAIVIPLVANSLLSITGNTSGCLDAAMIIQIIMIIFTLPTFSENTCKLMLSRKFFGHTTLDWNTIVTPHQVFQLNHVYQVPSNSHTFLYDVFNTYGHRKEFYLANNTQQVQYCNSSPECMRNILIDSAFAEYDNQMTVLQNLTEYTSATSIQTKYNIIGFDVNLNKVVAQLTDNEQQQFLCLLAICSNKLIAITMFDKLNSKLKTNILKYLSSASCISFIASDIPQTGIAPVDYQLLV